MRSALIILSLLSMCFGAANIDSIAVKMIRGDSASFTAVKFSRGHGKADSAFLADSGKGAYHADTSRTSHIADTVKQKYFDSLAARATHFVKGTVDSTFIVTTKLGVGGSQSPLFGVSGAQLTNGAIQYNSVFYNTVDQYSAPPKSGIVFGVLYNSGGTGATVAGINAGKENNTDGNYGGFLAFGTRPNGLTIAERMRISSTGLIGIGTAAPSSKLTVKGRTTDSGSIFATDTVYATMNRQSTTWHTFGGFQDSSVTITLSGTNWATITNATHTLWHGAEGEGMALSSDTMIIEHTSDNFGSVAITFSGQSGKDYYFRVYNITQAKQMGYKVGISATGANLQQVKLPFYLECNASDRLRMEVMTTNSGNNPSMKDAIFYVIYEHD